MPAYLPQSTGVDTGNVKPATLVKPGWGLTPRASDTRSPHWLKLCPLDTRHYACGFILRTHVKPVR